MRWIARFREQDARVWKVSGQWPQMFTVREKWIARCRRTCYQIYIADRTFMMPRCLEILSNKCLRSFLRSFANGPSKVASFWCLSLLVCFLSWNAIAEEQDPIAQLKQRCDQLEKKSKWPEAIAVAE